VKRTIFATTLIAALTLTAAAQEKPPLWVTGAGSTGSSEQPQWAWGTPPALCRPCLFYGGDLNPTDPNTTALSDENTLYVKGSSTYAAYNVPQGVTARVTGILVNVLASVKFDPRIASYDIRTGVVEGNGGTSIASGTAKIRVALTGRKFGGMNEYALLVRLPEAQSLEEGEYWFNVTATCTNGARDGSCYVGRIYLSNTTQDTNGISADSQPTGSMYVNSPFFGLTFVNWCNLGANSFQCGAASFGLTGTARKAE
jgi:hypothetical protein